MPRYRALTNTFISNRYLRTGDIFVSARPIPDSAGVIEELDAQNRPLKPAPAAPAAPENPILQVAPAVEPPVVAPVLEETPVPAPAPIADFLS